MKQKRVQFRLAWLLVALSLCGGIAPAVFAAARPQAVLSVHEVLRDENEDFVPDLRGKTVTVKGVLTSRPNHNDTTAIVHFQDDTGGLVLISSDLQMFDQLSLGDTVLVRGKVSQSRGMEQLVVEGIRMIVNGDPPQPRDVRTTDVLGERYSGQLVRVSGEIVARGDTNQAAQFFVHDDRGDVPLFVPWYFRTWRNGELNYKLWKGGKVSVTGIAGQDKAEPPYNAGYGLIPRTPEDFDFPPPPIPPPPPPSKLPLYIAIGISAFFALLAFYLWDRRRAADARTREVSTLLREIERSENEVKKQAAFARFNPNPVVEFFADGSLTYANEAARGLADTLEKDSVEELLPSESREIVRACVASREARSHCIVTVGNRTLSWSFFPVHELTSVHGYAQDITSQLELETQLRQAQKLEVIGQLAAGVAHDFNNILSVIQGYTALTLVRNDLPQKVAEPLAEIAAAAERATNLTRQLLTFSRRQAIEPKHINLGDLVSNLSRMLRRLLGEDIHLRLDCQVRQGWIDADPGMVEQVIMNLAINARDAMPDGGDLTLSVSRRELTTGEVGQFTEAGAGSYICLSVEDTGCGMDAATRKRIFEPFFTTKQPGKGTGLGLAMTHGIIAQHHGWIDVSSEVGRGTAFRVFFPAVDHAEVTSNGVVIPLPAVGGTETILVVEDDPSVRKLARSVLEEYGYHVLDAAAAGDALAAWKQHREQIRLLFTDIVLPDGMSGWKLAQQLRRENPGLKVICATGFDLHSVTRHAAPDAEMVLLRKPYPVQSLVRTVRECLDQRPILQPLGAAEASSM